jgi:hypothetical protein
LSLLNAAMKQSFSSRPPCPGLCRRYFLGYRRGKPFAASLRPRFELVPDFPGDGLHRLAGDGAPGFQDHLVPVRLAEDTGDLRLDPGGVTVARNDPGNNLRDNIEGTSYFTKIFSGILYPVLDT